MKFRVTLGRGRGAQPAHIQVQADGTATVGDVAHAIAACKESGVGTGGGHLSLRVFDSGDNGGRDLAPAMNLIHSGVASGSHIEVVDVSSTATAGAAVASVRIVSGPDSGTEVSLPLGNSSIGRSAENQVRLSDPRVSKTHAVITISDRVEVIDSNSANGVEVGGVRVSRAVLGHGDQFVVGDTVAVVEVTRPLARAAANTDITFIRSPRVLVRPRVVETDAPEVPKEPAPAPFPLLAMIAPLIMGAVLYAFTRSVLSLVFIGLSPILMLGSWASQKLSARRQRKYEGISFRATVAALDAELSDAADTQRQQLEELFPSLNTCLGALGGLGDITWSRRPENPEFGCVRLGLGDVPAVRRVKVQRNNGRPELWHDLVQMLAEHNLVERAPVVADLNECGNLGIAGDASASALVARGVVLQLAVTHSPSELVVACLTSTTGVERWRWLEWLPHVNPAQPVLGTTHLSSDEANGRRMLDALEALVEGRLGEKEASVPRGPVVGADSVEAPEPGLPLVVVVVDDALADLRRVTRLAELGPDAGVHLVWVGGQLSDLPAACRTYVDVDDGHVGMVRHELVVRPLEYEGADIDTATAAARQLAPMVDSGEVVDDESDLPASISMVNLFGHDQADDPDQILAHWRENGTLIDHAGPARPRETGLSIRALVGHTGIEPFTLDLRTQGPHALVGGTTGAGKSEFLQAWLLGMANAYSPDRLTFLLVDYKGGTAFAHCVKLPHCVGLVTDLSPHLVRRVLRSLRAEIHHRELVLNAKGAKDLVELEMRGDPECPPTLVIVVDEFAALKMDVPEFVDGVIDIAQRGRSLGLHLVLATQRPAGVIGDNIRANTNLRIALRMNDEHDSKDVIGDVISAHIDPATPGRGVAKVGPGRLLRFQSGYPGARTTREPELPPVSIQEVSFGNHQSWKVPRGTRERPQVDKDIERIVASVGAACERAAVPPPRRPWLDELSPVYDLLKLRQRRDDQIVLGVVDEPDSQRQFTEYYRPEVDGNILIVGASGSGKSTALRSLAVASSVTPRSGPVHVYGLDFTGSGLVSLEALPNVGSVVPGNDDERVARLIRTLDQEVSERADKFAAVNASTLSEYRAQAEQPQEPRILLLLDGFSAFYEEYNGVSNRHALLQRLQRVLAEGRAVGIHCAVTADRSNAVNTTVGSSFLRRIVLRQVNEDAYMDLGIPKDALSAQSPPGRGIDTPGEREIQLASPGGHQSVADQIRAVELLARALADRHPIRPRPIRALPGLVHLSEVLPRPAFPMLGISDETLTALKAPSSGAAKIAGPAGSGKSNAVAVWAQTLRAAVPGVELIHLSHQRTPISGLRTWRRTAVGATEVKSVVENLLQQMTPGTDGKPAHAVFVEGTPALCADGLSALFAELARRCITDRNLFVGEGDMWDQAYELNPVLKSAGRGLFLQMGGESGFAHVDTMLPKLARSDLIPGRGFWVESGGVTKVQVPVQG